jgi:hypothetical protein
MSREEFCASPGLLLGQKCQGDTGDELAPCDSWCWSNVPAGVDNGRVQVAYVGDVLGLVRFGIGGIAGGKPRASTGSALTWGVAIDDGEGCSLHSPQLLTNRSSGSWATRPDHDNIGGLKVVSLARERLCNLWDSALSLSSGGGNRRWEMANP